MIDPERIEYGALAVEHVTGGHSMPSGLVRRADCGWGDDASGPYFFA
jgi:hypothetical protein